MAKKKSMQELVKPLRKLSLLVSTTTSSSTGSKSTQPHSPTTTTTPFSLQHDHEQHDIISWLPREIALAIFSMLSFQDLVRVQLTCRIWRRIAQDASIWRARYHQLHRLFPDLYLHKRLLNDTMNDDPASDPSLSSWQTRYCQAQTHANWRMGNVQRAKRISEHDGSRLLSVKLKQHWLVTLSESNTVQLYEYAMETGFTLHRSWHFGESSIVECVDILPEIHILVVAMRGSKCMFYDVSTQSTEPIQVLKGGSHPWFFPDSIALTQNYFAVSGRKPSAVFIWNWRKGVRLSNRAFDNQPHSVYISGTHIITISVDGILHTFDIHDPVQPAITFTLPPCNMPCLNYDGSFNLVLAPYAARRIHHFRWDQSINEDHEDNEQQQQQGQQPEPQRSVSSSVYSSIFKRRRSAQQHRAKVTGLRRHSSYNDYGYACQARTAQYIKRSQPSTKSSNEASPDFTSQLRLCKSIRTTPLGWTAHKIVSVAVHNDRVAILNRYGDIALFALNGTTAAHVTLRNKRIWMDERSDTNFRDEDELSDGYDFIRLRLAMGSMGIIYASRGGSLWWLDFACRPSL